MKKGFIQLNKEILNNASISDGAFRTYAVLLSFKYRNGRVFPSISTIAKQRGKHVNSIMNHLNELRKAKLITSKKRGYSMSNEYYFNTTSGCDNREGTGTKKSGSIPPKTGAQSYQNIDTKNIKDNNIEINNNVESVEERQRKWVKFKQEAFKRYPWLEGKQTELIRKKTMK